MLLRIPYSLRIIIASNSFFHSAKVQTVANLNRFSIGKMSFENVRLIIRSSLTIRPVQILSLTVVCNWVIVAYLILLSELRYNLVPTYSDNLSAVLEYRDAVWLAPITFTTIGYGDFYPKSNFGRFFCIYLGLLGAMSTSMLIAILSENLTMNKRERMMYSTLNKNELCSQLQVKAAVVLQRLVRQTLLDKKKTIKRPNADELKLIAQNSILENRKDLSAKKRPSKTLKNFSFVASEEEDFGRPTSLDGQATNTHSRNSKISHCYDEIANMNPNTKAKGYCPIVYSTNILEAISDFSHLRRKLIFAEFSESMSNEHIIMDLYEDVSKVNQKIDKIETRLEQILDCLEIKISSIRASETGRISKNSSSMGKISRKSSIVSNSNYFVDTRVTLVRKRE